MITQNELKEKLSYDSDTGEFIWIQSRSGVVVGSVAGTVNGHGYINIQINGSIYFAHRLAWLYVYGEFPNTMLDHKDRCKINNRIDNLRLSCAVMNQRNRSIDINNTSGTTGVSWHKVPQKWVATIGINGKCIRLGSFEELDDAISCRAAANAKYGFVTH